MLLLYESKTLSWLFLWSTLSSSHWLSCSVHSTDWCSADTKIIWCLGMLAFIFNHFPYCYWVTSSSRTDNSITEVFSICIIIYLLPRLPYPTMYLLVRQEKRSQPQHSPVCFEWLIRITFPFIMHHCSLTKTIISNNNEMEDLEMLSYLIQQRPFHRVLSSDLVSYNP